MLLDIPDRVLVRIGGVNSNPPSCASSSNAYYIFDSSTSMGKQFYAALLAAKYADASITIFGFSTCNLRSNAEDLRGIG